MKESQLQKQIADILRIKGIAFCKARFDKRSNITKGWPDFSLAIKGMAVAFEVKIDKNPLTKDQMECHAKMAQNGWRIYCIRSLEEAVDVINHFSSQTCK